MNEAIAAGIAAAMGNQKTATPKKKAGKFTPVATKKKAAPKSKTSKKPASPKKKKFVKPTASSHKQIATGDIIEDEDGNRFLNVVIELDPEPTPCSKDANKEHLIFRAEGKIVSDNVLLKESFLNLNLCLG